MKYVNIYGHKRDLGKKAVRSIRLSGNIPCILYGKNMNIPFYSSLENLRKIVYTIEIYGVILKIEGYDKSINAIRKEIQFDPVNEKILHVDFYKIDKSKSMTLEIPVKSFGRPIGVAKGGKYYSPVRKLKVKASIDNMPEYIQFNIDSLDIGDKITVGDLYNNQYTILHPSHTLIANVKNTRTIVKGAQEEENKEKDDKTKIK
ncbi:50S ribosomal protein L25 [Blattabacterium sp. (Nauphoeta cinerea)]|uniref:50S ribosomal protein L25 n=1 Tax=Blattabacterium sp. (Nauphoeta cinerea) TaxID=1316444 RepID=UPI0003B0E082|nr:50S ribosomal protein L25 [Blattabacterium sp. (Nauphoeta cinerea)]AGW86248.1 50S ribosomal protein L25 [Blattabacterium sp. (Nauphoeta cinerea)]